MCSFCFKSRDNPLKCFKHLKNIGKIFRQLTHARPKSDQFARAAASKAGKSSIQTFRDELSAAKRNKFSNLCHLSYPCLNIGQVCGC